MRYPMTDKKPFEITREALMLLTTRKLVPTPANYHAVYNEIAGTSDIAPFPEDEQAECIEEITPLL